MSFSKRFIEDLEIIGPLNTLEDLGRKNPAQLITLIKLVRDVRDFILVRDLQAVEVKAPVFPKKASLKEWAAQYQNDPTSEEVEAKTSQSKPEDSPPSISLPEPQSPT